MGATWSLRLGTVAKRKAGKVEQIVGVVRRVDADSDAVYVATVTAEHCGLQRDDMGLTTLAGEHVAAVVFDAASATAPAAIAAALCNEYRSKRT